MSVKKNIRWQKGVWHHTEQTKDRLRELAKAHPEWRTGNLGKYSRKGAIPWNKGLFGAYSETYKKKLSEARKGKHYLNASLVRTGKHYSLETEFKKGGMPWNLGKAHSNATLLKLEKTLFKPGHVPWNLGKHLSDENKEKNRRAQQKIWQNPEYAKKMFKKLGIKPNNEELYLDAILQLNFPSQFRYVGDGQIFIARKNPDFFNINGKKLLIEYNGYRLHGTHTKEKDIAKSEHYAKYGFRTLNLYREDLKDEKSLVEIVKHFVEENNHDKI